MRLLGEGANSVRARMSDTQSHYKAILAPAPGPSPEYLLTSGPSIRSRHGDLQWACAGDEAPLTGNTLLQSPDGSALAVIGLHSYVLPLEAPAFLVWAVTESVQLKRDFIMLHLFDADRLEPIADVVSACAEMERNHVKISSAGETVVSTALPVDLSPRLHRIYFQEALHTVPELLILAHSVFGGPADTAFDLNTSYLCLFIVRPQEETVEIFPQDWFNSGGYDAGSQEVTRMARDPASGKIYGEGTQLGVFVLDDTYRNVERWLHVDPFYHPEQ